MVVFFDIDGTLVDDNTQVIPESTVKAVEQLAESGHIPVVNTGRPYTHVDPRVRAMAFQGYVCGCGMEVRYRDQWISRQHPTPEVCRIVRDAVRSCNMQVLYENRESAILTDGKWSSHPGCLREARRTRDRGKQVVEIDSLPQPEFMKFVTLDGENCRREEFFRITDPYFERIIRDHTLVEYPMKGCSKAKGMALLLRHLGVDRQDTLAIGDSTNDLPMFKAAGHTVCMGDGMESVKAQAEFVTDTVLGDGIMKALQHYHLI